MDYFIYILAYCGCFVILKNIATLLFPTKKYVKVSVDGKLLALNKKEYCAIGKHYVMFYDETKGDLTKND